MVASILKCHLLKIWSHCKEIRKLVLYFKLDEVVKTTFQILQLFLCIKLSVTLIENTVNYQGPFSYAPVQSDTF